MKQTILLRQAITSLLLIICSIATTGQTAKTPSFPGAEGYGMYVSGGRGGAVYHVTNLNDSGEGSLRWAINQTGARTIIFDVSGTIYLESQLDIKNGNLTIAGQTAPGGGICVADWPVVIKASNVIIRYMRFRLGNEYVNKAEGDGGHEGDGLGGFDGSNIMIDHCSISWSIDECLAVYGNRNTTVQWCIASQSLRNAGHQKGAHGYGGMMGGGRTTYHHNLIAHHDSRTPRFAFRSGDETSVENPTDYRNNVIYNWCGNGCYGAEDMCINIVNNYYKPGPGTAKRNANIQKRIVGPGVGTRTDSEGNTIYVWGKYYLDGNVNSKWSDVTKNNWTIGLQNQVDGSSQHGTWTSTTKDTIRRTEVMPFALVTTHTAEKAYEKVLGYVGASLYRDEVDQLIISDTQNGVATYTGSTSGNNPGIIDSPYDIMPSDAGNDWNPWPTLESTTAPVDTDGDGMPDIWEDTNNLDPNDATDGAIAGSDGYTNLEKYLNSIVANITAAQNADGEVLGEDIATTGPLYEDDEETEVSEYEISNATHLGNWEFKNGFTITCASGEQKYQKSDDYDLIKISQNVQYTINIPEGITITQVRLMGKDWYDNRPTYLAELNGETYTDEDYPFSYDGIEYTIDITPATGTLTFTTAPKLCGLKLYLVKGSSTGINNLRQTNADAGNIYTTSGMLIKRNASQEDIHQMPAGVYIMNNKKIISNQ